MHCHMIGHDNYFCQFSVLLKRIVSFPLSLVQYDRSWVKTSETFPWAQSVGHSRQSMSVDLSV